MLPKGKETRGVRPSRLSLGNTNGEPPPVFDIIKCGYLRKLKTMKKKFFLLRMDSDLGPARLEYYDSEKKWRTGIPCKRSIVLKTCFNINRKMDSKQKFAIALYTKDDCFAVALENELEMDDWLSTLLALQQGHSGLEGDTKPKPNFEHVWQVNVKSKGLGSSRNITGAHRLCLTSKSLSLVKMNLEEPNLLDFPLMSIRRCGHSDCFFFMELGRSSVTGAGELWMQTEDTIIAQNMHEAILGAMKSSREHEDLGPLNRPRSASTSENSKPLATRPRPIGVVPPQPILRDRCDSMPSRSRTVSEGHHDISGSLVTSAYSDSAGSSVSMDELESDFHHRYHSHSSDVSVHTEPTITEEALDDYLPMTPGADGDERDYMQMAPHRSSNADSNPGSPTDYMDMMATPSSDAAEGYIPMSPVGSMSIDLSSIVTKKGSSESGYVPMAPVVESSHHHHHSDKGYMEMMTSLSSSLPKCTSPSGGGYMELNSSTHHSLQDINYSSLPKMEEFHLDKVKSYFPPSTEDSDDYIKPVRAYSIGSRPQLRKNHLSTHLESFRVRAYSFGSQASGGGNFNRIEAELGSMKKMDSRASGKSSSAPLLPSGPPQRRSGREDLMEINYDASLRTREGSERVRTFSHGSHRQHTSSRHADAKTRVVKRDASDTYMAMGCEKKTDPRKSNSGDYVNLELGSLALFGATQKSSIDHNYINLQLGGVASTTSPQQNNSDYTMMSPVVKSPAEVLPEDNDKAPFVRCNVVDAAAYENILIAPGSDSGSRPSSVSSDRELNYASLDLAPGDDTPRSPRTPKNQNPSPPEQVTEVPLSYAEIDFTKSEGLRHTSGSLREGRV